MQIYTPDKYIPAQTRCIFAFTYIIYVFFTCMYFGHVSAQQIYTHANVSFPLISSEIGSKNTFVCVKSKKYFNPSHFKTNTTLRIKFHAHYVFINILIFSYNNAQMHPYVNTVQYLESIPFVQKAWKTCVQTSVSDKNQSSSQTKGFMHALVQKI